VSAYNLYLLDESRDPKVVTRLARITGLAESLVRRELRHPPFLILKEHALSPAVAVRRELELLGLSLRLELVERPSGDQRHPLAGEQAPDDGAEIVLEEGHGFVEAAAPSAGTAAPLEHAATSRRAWRKPLLLGLVMLMALFSAWWLGKGMRGPGSLESTDRISVEQHLPLLLSQMEAALRAQPSQAEAKALVRKAEELDARLRPLWETLSRGDRQALDALQAGRQTLLLRQSESRAGAASGVWTPRDLRRPERSGGAASAFWQHAEEALAQRTPPLSLGAQLALERLDEELRAISRGRDEAARARLLALEGKDPGSRARLGALRLAGSLQQKGVVWTGEGEARQAWADLPDSTLLDVEAAGVVVDQAVVEGGRVVFTRQSSGLEAVSLRLAALERQPGPVRRLLEAGLKLAEPELFFGTIPGSQLPRLNTGAAAVQWEQAGDPALKSALRRLGLMGEDTRFPVLSMEGEAPGKAPDVADWLRAAAQHYQKARTWPQRLELRTPEGRFHISGCELWLLSRQI
jgi:hypothetical protein